VPPLEAELQDNRGVPFESGWLQDPQPPI